MKNNVKKLRMAAGITLAELAERSGVPVSTISDIEHGREPRLMTAILIARALGKEVEQVWPVR